jgi:hypothetical protein
MEKYSATSPLFRFKEDRIHSVIKETMQKKPVNKDYTLGAKVKPKKTINQSESEKLVKIDPRDYLASVGFVNGRLKEKNWVVEDDQKKQKIKAPGPVLSKLKQVEELAEASEFEDSEMASKKIKNKFKRLPLHLVGRGEGNHEMIERAATSRTELRQTKSQLKAKEYLCFLAQLNSKEKSFLNEQVCGKEIEIRTKADEFARKSEKKLNGLGIFSNEVNQLRVASMIPVKINTQVKLKVDPLAKNAKNFLVEQKAKKLINFTPEPQKEKNYSSRSISRDKTLETIKSVLVKEDFNRRQFEDTTVKSQVNQYKKIHWVERINKTVNDIMKKTKPDEKMLRIMAL